jgi:DMSO/TMAO reductase YedYZ heme-binding membrane subunit
MKFLAGLILALAITFVFRGALRRYPAILYSIAVVLDILFIVSRQLYVPSWLKEYILFLFQNNNLAMGLFIVVMFIGVFKEGSGIRKMLMPIRSELSILASILCIGHIVVYGQTYLTQLLSSLIAVPVNRVIATVVAFALVLLLIPLAITSTITLRKRIHPHTWKRIQRLAYPFFGLIFIHLCLYLVPSAFAGSTSALFSVIAYLVVGFLYLVFRLRLHFQTSKAGFGYQYDANADAGSL